MPESQPPRGEVDLPGVIRSPVDQQIHHPPDPLVIAASYSRQTTDSTHRYLLRNSSS